MKLMIICSAFLAARVDSISLFTSILSPSILADVCMIFTISPPVLFAAKNTAAKFDVSYSQVYSRVKKYDTDGADGLTDRRGRHKTDAEVDELERLRRENLRLKRKLEEKDMVVELLKK